MVVRRVRFIIDKTSNPQGILPSVNISDSEFSGFTVSVEFRTYLGPLLVWVKRVSTGYVPQKIYEELQQTLQWSDSNGTLPETLGKLAQNPANHSGRQELLEKLNRHRRYLSEVLWGEQVWETRERADEIKQHLQKLANKGLYLELVLHNEMHQYMWETLQLESSITGNLSLVRMRFEDLQRGNLRHFRLNKKRVRLLTIVANPERRQLADLSQLAAKILHRLIGVSFLKSHTRVEYRIPPGITAKPTGRQILEFYRKQRGKYNVWFLLVHGAADRGGLLYYEDAIGQPQEIELADLYTHCRGAPPDICILFACDIAGFGSEFVDGLLGRDIKLVVAMQAPISFTAAEEFAKFWEELDDFRSISLRSFEKAVKRARAEILDRDTRHEQIIPVLYTRARYGWPDWTRWPLLACLAAFILFLSIVFLPILRRSDEVIASPPPLVTFTITCAEAQLDIEAGEPITLSAVNAVFIEPNYIPNDWEALTGALNPVSGEEGKFSYAPGGSGPDMITFTFVLNDKTKFVTTKSIPVTVIAERDGICEP